MFGQHLTQHADVHAYDLKQDDNIKARAASAGVSFLGTLSEVIDDADWVLSLVTAEQAPIAAKQVSQYLKPNQYFLEMNSISPSTKQANVAICENLVDLAIMAPVYPKQANVPLLLSHPDGEAISSKLSQLGLNVRCVGQEIGRAAAIKMCRSVMIKGMEALTLECFQAAQFYDVEAEIKSSLHGSFPGMGWDKDRMEYWFERVGTHGIRRAEEMREVAKTVKDAKVNSEMSKAVAETFEKYMHRNKC